MKLESREVYEAFLVEKDLPKGRYIVRGSNPNHLIEAYWSGENWYLSASDEDIVLYEVTHYIKLRQPYKEVKTGNNL